MSNQSRTRITDQGGSRLLVLSTLHSIRYTPLNNNTGLKLVGSLYLTEIKQVHSEDDKIIIIDTFEGCLAARPGILITSLIPAEEVELHHRIFPPMKCTIVCNK